MAIPESFVLAAGALHQAKFALGGLVVDQARMAHNLGLSNGLIVAEAVMMHLAPVIGRQQAHDLVYAACRVVDGTDRPLAEVLADDAEVSRHFDRAALDRLTNPANYLGLAPAMVDRVVAHSARLSAP
jgi:3-carboxy-cis,cis-muconate cycloisomerase